MLYMRKIDYPEMLNDKMPLGELLALTTLTAAASDTTPLQKTDKPIAVCTVDNYRFLAFKNGIAVVEMFDVSRRDYIVDWHVIRLDRLGAVKFHFMSQSPEPCVSVIPMQDVLKMPWAVRLLVEVEDEKEREQDEQYRRRRVVATESALDELQYRNYLYGIYGTAVDEFVATKIAMKEALATLTDKQRKVLILHRVYGYKIKEIAERTGLTEQSVRQRLQNAYSRIRAYLYENTNAWIR